MPDIIPCTIKSLPAAQLVKAAKTAISVNPANHPPAHAVIAAPTPMRLALIVGKRWGPQVRLTVGFLDDAPADLQNRILTHMNAWGTRANVEFASTSTATDAAVRIAREPDGYWSYLGTDILHIPAEQQTMNLQGFTMDTPDSEFYRVVRHETGHTLGFPHEHMRRKLVDRIDVKKAIAYFGQTQGWSPEEVRQQVLTPLEKVKVKGSYRADELSIMCYRIPGAVTKSGRPILGGADIDESDYHFASSIYPK